MKTTACFLLLLICSLSTAQLHSESENNIIAQEEQSQPERQEPADAEDQRRICGDDIHAVLRDMSASLAEQGAEIRFLQKENEAQAAKLKELESQEIELERQKTELDKIKRQLQVKQVAFSASLLVSGSGTVGPFNAQTPLVFRHVLTNIGNAYSPNTGFFTAPVRGVYHFEFFVAGYGHSSHPAAAVLVRNGQNICTAYQHQAAQFGGTGQGVTLLLDVGNVVFLRLWGNSWMYDDDNNYSTFSGHLLFTV